MMEALFLSKKVLSAVLMPLPVGMIILAVSALLYVRGRHRIAKLLAVSVLVSGYVLSLMPVAKFIASPLESQFPKYAGQKVNYVLVLGGYHSSDERKPLSSLLSQTSLMRLIEGVSIYRLNPGSKLLLSGYKGRDVISNAKAMAKVAGTLGVPVADIVLATSVKDTAEEAKHWMQYMFSQPHGVMKGQQKQTFALVTSATHMPRSVFLFDQYPVELSNIDLIPAPTVFISAGHHGLHWRSFFPNAASMRVVEIAWHEYLGILWAHLKHYGLT